VVLNAMIGGAHGGPYGGIYPRCDKRRIATSRYHDRAPYTRPMHLSDRCAHHLTAQRRSTLPSPLHIVTYGHGPRRFIGLHGWGAEHTKSFKDVLAHRPDDVTFIGVDLPGCGQSAPPPDWAWAPLHDHLAHQLDTQLAALPNDGPATLIGSCAGSYHALELARRLPHRVEQLVLLEPFAYMPWFFSIFLTPITGRALYYNVFHSSIGKRATQASLRRQGVTGDYDMLTAFGASDPEVPYRYLQHYGAIKTHRVFADIAGPTRILYGQQSWRAIHDSIPLWRELWPDLTAHMLPGVGHMFNQEAPALAASLMFLPPETRAPRQAA
jgi:pimeloyl-ACP methyl ester carboxylesterase